MKKYKLYLSGEFYGNIEFVTDGIYHEKFNVFDGCLEQRSLLSEEDRLRYRTIFNLDLVSLADKIDKIEEKLSKESQDQHHKQIQNEKSKSITLECGAVFSKWEEDNPHSCEMWVQRNAKFPLDFAVEDGSIIGITVPSRERVTVLVMDGKEDLTILREWRKYAFEEKRYKVSDAVTVKIPMGDDVSLATDIIMPKEAVGKLPTILVRTPYGRQLLQEIYHTYVRKGYCVVVQDVRGRNDSGGEWEPMVHEIEDGNDTLEWIGQQNWSNGKVGMVGGSYLGYVQWAAAASGNRYLKALVSVVTAGSPFVDIPRRGGTLVSGALAWTFAMSKKHFMPELMVRDDWDKVLDIRPLENIGEVALGYSIPFMNQWICNYDNSSMWEKMDWTLHKDKINVPALIMSGWYDDNGMGTTEALNVTRDYGKGTKKIILGPWVHSGNASRDIHGVPFGNNSLRYDIDLVFLKWLDHHIKGIENGIDRTNVVEYYTVGSNQWKSADNWPIKAIENEEWYLSGNEILTRTPPEMESYRSYLYDPEDPAPYLIDVSENESAVPGNYKDVDRRKDVLVYETSCFDTERTITGDITVEFYGGSDAPDTDWLVRISDVDEDGNAIKLVDGVLSARYRDGFNKSKFMEAGGIYQFKITTTKISAAIKTGHRLRLSITSSGKGYIFPNSNTEAGFNSVEKKVANNRVYCGGKYISKAKIPFELGGY